MGKLLVAWKMLPRYVGPSTAATTPMRTKPLARLAAVHIATDMEFVAMDAVASCGIAACAAPAPRRGLSPERTLTSRRLRGASASRVARARRRRPQPPTGRAARRLQGL